MQWSKLRWLVRERFADCLKDRLDIHSARYGNCSCGHAWLTLDKQVIANFCTRAASIAEGLEPGSDRRNPKYKAQFLEFGEMSRQDAYAACWAFVHELGVEQALADPDPLVQSLAVVDHRLGKRRLARVNAGQMHPLAAKLLQVRREAENPSGSLAA